MVSTHSTTIASKVDKTDLVLLLPTVCKPCQAGWMQFKSNCYLFEESDYYYNWRSWEGSRKRCKEVMADLVVIESLEEQARPISADLFRNDRKWAKYLNSISENVAMAFYFALFSTLLYNSNHHRCTTTVGIHQQPHKDI